MRANEYLILEECVARGIQLGLARAHKHNDNPTPGQIQQAVEVAVLSEIAEYFFFNEQELGD